VGAFIVEQMARHWDDAFMRIVVVTDILIIPLAIASPLMPRFEYALACQVGLSLLMMIGVTPKLAAQQMIVPNEMRAQVTAVMMFTISVLGSGLGPTIIAVVTDYFFRDESQLRYAMAWSAAIATPILLVCAIIGMRAYRHLLRDGTIA
jgi:MFS family permease